MPKKILNLLIIQPINKMGEAITNLSSQTTLLRAFDQLNIIDGIRFVIATKVYRFCHPNIGAALDRHVSIFSIP